MDLGGVVYAPARSRITGPMELGVSRGHSYRQMAGLAGALLLLRCPSFAQEPAQDTGGQPATDSAAPLAAAQPPEAPKSAGDQPQATTTVASGETSPRGSETDPNRWSVEIEPRLWYAVFRGNITLAHGSNFDVNDVNMDEPHDVPAGQAVIRSGQWAFTFDGSSNSFDGTDPSSVAIVGQGIAIAPGQLVHFDVTYSQFMLTGGYSFKPLVESEDHSTKVWIDAFGGAAVYHLDFDFGPAGGAGINENDTWFEPLVGGRLHIELPYGFSVECQLDVGAAMGPGTGIAYDITPKFRWFVMGNRNIAIEIGFRHVKADLTTGNDGFEFNVAEAGLFGAVVLRF